MEKTAQERLREILAGIDTTEDWGDKGWWETQYGALFGKQKLAEVEALLLEAQAEAWDKGRASANVTLPMHPPKMPSNPYAKETE